MSYKRKFDRWLRDSFLTCTTGHKFAVHITVKDVGGVPNPDGEAEVDWFAENFAAEWNGVTKKLLELNPGTSGTRSGGLFPGTFTCLRRAE
jgi:hypothetical protein